VKENTEVMITPPYHSHNLIALSSIPQKAYMAAILAILRSVDAAATLVCNEIDMVLDEHEVRQALEDLRKGVENLKSDILVYEVLIKHPKFGCEQKYVIGLRSQSQ
jgi:hypothetical protein